MWVDALAVEQIKSRSARLGVMKSPSVEAIGESIRRCAPGRWGEVKTGRIRLAKAVGVSRLPL